MIHCYKSFKEFIHQYWVKYIYNGLEILDSRYINCIYIWSNYFNFYKNFSRHKHNNDPVQYNHYLRILESGLSYTDNHYRSDLCLNSFDFIHIFKKLLHVIRGNGFNQEYGSVGSLWKNIIALKYVNNANEEIDFIL